MTDHRHAEPHSFPRRSRRTDGFDANAPYTGKPPWDIDRPQPAFLALAEAGAIKGRVLDVGCGTGEHALMAAALGLEATGVDIASMAIDRARAKARDRHLDARFLVWDAFEVASLGEHFDTVIDCGLFHIFEAAERPAYVDNLRAVTRPGARYHMLCFSENEPGDWGPHRVTRQEIRASFAEGWQVDSIDPATLQVTFDPNGVQGWLATLTRI